MTPLSFVFYGTPEFATTVLDQLERAGRLPVAIICQPDRPKGRGRKLIPAPSKVWAEERGIEVLQPRRQKDPTYLERFEAIGADLAVVAAYGQLLSKIVLNIPRLGFINVHPSLVPRYRGAAPIQWTLINGDEHTGTTILKVTPRLDEGDLLSSEQIRVDLNDTAHDLRRRLGALGGRLVTEVMERFALGQTDGQPQDDSQVVLAPALTKADAHIDWAQPALEIHNRIRGVQPWPGAVTSLRGRRFKLHRATLDRAAAPAGSSAGKVFVAAGDRILVHTGQGSLRLLEVQAEGKRRMDARAFLAGRQIEAGEILGT
jgi:methionyl-tRNA formyltransferase